MALGAVSLFRRVSLTLRAADAECSPPAFAILYTAPAGCDAAASAELYARQLFSPTRRAFAGSHHHDFAIADFQLACCCAAAL